MNGFKRDYIQISQFTGVLHNQRKTRKLVQINSVHVAKFTETHFIVPLHVKSIHSSVCKSPFLDRNLSIELLSCVCG